MLRASKKVTLVSGTIEFNNGFVLSTSVNLNGLILRADQPIPQLITDFLASKKVMIKKIRIAFKPDESTKDILLPCYEDYIKIYGTFSISKTDVKNFIGSYEYRELLKQTCNNLTPLERSEQLQSDIEKQYILCLQHTEYTDTVHAWHIELSVMFADQQFDCVMDKLTLNNHIIAVEHIRINAKEFTTSGTAMSFVDEHKKERTSNTGLMSSLLSKKNIYVKFKNSMQFQDSIMGSEQIDIESKNNSSRLILSIDKDIDWLNNPYRNFSPLFNATSKIHKCKFDQEELAEETELETEDNWIHITKTKIHHPNL